MKNCVRTRIMLCLLLVGVSQAATAEVTSPKDSASSPSVATGDTVRVAGIVLKWLRTDKAANFRRAEKMIRHAAGKGAQIVCTSECFLDGYAIKDKTIPLDEYRALGETIPSGTFYLSLAALADELDIFLVAGMLEADGEARYNTAVLIDPQGKLIGKYRKQQLGHESVRNTPGKESPVFQTPFGKVGIMICADRRYPDLVKRLCAAGADFLICPSGGMFGPKTNDPILQARSKENGIWITFVHPAEFLVTDPEGEIRRCEMLGDRLEITPPQVDGEHDTNEVFVFDLPLATRSNSSVDKGEVESLLKSNIVGDVLPLAEVQRYCEQRVPKMPKFESAAEWQTEADRLRAAILESVVYRGEAVRWRDAKTQVEWLDAIEGGPGYRIKKLRYEALPGLWVPALLYEPEDISGKVPAVLNVNGHTGLGKQYPPKQLRCINQAKRGILALNIEWLGMGQLRSGGYSHARMNQLDLCGTSGLAPFYLCMKRGLDVLLSLDHTDPNRVAVTGLSGGGWQTIILSSLDTRVKLANPVAGYSSFLTRIRHFKDLGDSEQTPNDLATLADYTHLTAMMAPRPTLLTYNSKDNCCFESGYALKPLTDAAAPVYRLFDEEDSLRTHVNDDPGTHNYEQDNRQAFYRMLRDFFLADDEQFDPNEIPSQDEVKSEEELAVALPEKNEDFHTLALALSKQLPRDADLPRQKQAAVPWQRTKRAELAEVVQAKQYRVEARKKETKRLGELTAAFWQLSMDDDWTVPAVELVRGNPQKTAILVADTGRAGAAAEAVKLLESGHRVIAVDVFYFGESKITQKAFLFALLVAAVGDRPLGLQAGQVAAAARWAAGRDDIAPVTLVAVGPRSCTYALIAAALEEQAIAGVQLHGALASLKEIIEKNWGVTAAPELFCFGLLERFDIKQLAALVAPRPVSFVGPGDRAKQELADLEAWYRTLGSEFQPLAR